MELHMNIFIHVEICVQCSLILKLRWSACVSTEQMYVKYLLGGYINENSRLGFSVRLVYVSLREEEYFDFFFFVNVVCQPSKFS